MKKSVIYLILIPILIFVLYNTWQYKQPMIYLWNGLILLGVIIVYKLTNHQKDKASEDLDYNV